MNGKHIEPRCKSNCRIAEALSKARSGTFSNERTKEGETRNKALAEKAIKCKKIMTEMMGCSEEHLIISHREPITFARGIIFMELHKDGYSLPKIGGAFYKHHSTVLGAINLVKGLIDVKDPIVTDIYNKFQSRL